MTIKDFRGQVKVSDVQNAFDEIVNRINSQVDVYNSFFDLQDYDLTKSSPLLGASGYTLSVGGLKSVLSSYANTVIGCRTFRIDDETLLVSDGFCITPDKVYRINTQIMGGASAPDVRPEASKSFYNYYGSDTSGQIISVDETVIGGDSFNHLSSIPFEFNKVYKFTAGYFDSHIGRVLAMNTLRLGEYNANVNKVVPIMCFNNINYYSAQPLSNQLGNNGDAVARGTVTNVTSSISSFSIPADMPEQDTLVGYIQKVRQSDGKIVVYMTGLTKTESQAGYTIWRQFALKIQDASGSTAFTDMMSRCEYIIECSSSSNSNDVDFASRMPYYEISGTLEDLQSINDLGEASYYPTIRPAENAISTEEIYYNYIEDKLIFNAYTYGDDVAYVDKDSEGNYVLKLKNTGAVIQNGGIVLVSYLNWNSEDVLLSGIKNLQLEDENISMTTQNVNIPCEGHVRQTLDTSSSGKFVSFVKRNTTNAGSTGGTCNFMGLNLINSYHSESGLYRRHWVTYPINIIYIPYKFNPSMQLSGATGRYVYSYNINRKT